MRRLRRPRRRLPGISLAAPASPLLAIKLEPPIAPPEVPFPLLGRPASASRGAPEVPHGQTEGTDQRSASQEPRSDEHHCPDGYASPVVHHGRHSSSPGRTLADPGGVQEPTLSHDKVEGSGPGEAEVRLPSVGEGREGREGRC